MWKIEDVLSELKEELGDRKSNEKGLPPGFRFHPTDEELITFYLASKVFNHPLPPSNNNTTTTSSCLFPRSSVEITEVDLNRCEPWDLPEKARMGEREWYFYSVRDRKYPTGLRTNRATATGYWKATGKDRQVYSLINNNNNNNNNNATGASRSSSLLIGMKKTLVFYEGRAPRGLKTRWVMHEYRLDGHFSSFRLNSKEEWVICRIFQKSGGSGDHQRPKYPSMASKIHPSSSSSPTFLGCLPPLLDTPTAANSSASSAALHSLSCPKSYDDDNHHEHTNFLLNSLLSNPLPLPALPLPPPFPSFSTPLMSQTAAPPSTDPKDLNSLSLSSPTTSAAVKPDHWLDKLIPPQVQIHHYHPTLGYYDQQQQMDPQYLSNCCRITGGAPTDVDHGDAAVQLDMSASAAALSRLLDPTAPIKLPAEPSWPFHPLCS